MLTNMQLKQQWPRNARTFDVQWNARKISNIRENRTAKICGVVACTVNGN